MDSSNIWSNLIIFDFFKFQNFKIQSNVIFCGIIWWFLHFLVSLVLSFPILLDYDLTEEQYYIFNGTTFSHQNIIECVKTSSILTDNFIHTYTVTTSFLLPSIVIIYCYIRIVDNVSAEAGQILIVNILFVYPNQRYSITSNYGHFAVLVRFIWSDIM